MRCRTIRSHLVACLIAAAMSAPTVVQALPTPRQAEKADEEAVDDAERIDEDAPDEDADEDAADDEGQPRPKRRPGAVQMEKPEEDERLVDPEAARRAQFFGNMPLMPFPVPMPQFPMPGPMGGAAAGGMVPQGTGVVVGQAFQFSSGFGKGGGPAMVVEQWTFGPNGWVKQPAAGGQEGVDGARRDENAQGKPAAGKKNAAKRAAAAKKPAGQADTAKRADSRTKRDAAAQGE